MMTTLNPRVEWLYLKTLKHQLIDLHRCGGYTHKKKLRIGPYQLSRVKKVDIRKRINGEDWPENAESMIGLRRMNNIQVCISRIIEEKIPGDLLEAGTWRGGASIFMAANLMVHNSHRRLFVCDSFRGLPKPTLVPDAGDNHHKHKYLSVSKQEVIDNFNKYDILDYVDVRFVEGWFKDTMPGLRYHTFSLIRLDGDMYESTMQVLKNLYDRLSPGGYVIVDDWALKPCQQAVRDFLQGVGLYTITQITPIDNTAVYFRKLR